MKILVATIGSRGDVQPYINLCQGLLAAGQNVTLATNPTLCPLAEAQGVKTFPVGKAVDMNVEGAHLMAQSFDNMWIGMVRVMQLGARLVEEAYADILRLCESADLVITSDTGSGVAEAEKIGVPWLSVTLQPARIPVSQTAASGIGRIIGFLLGKVFVAPTNRFRKRVGAPLVKDISKMLSSRMILLPVSSFVAPPDSRWPEQVYQTGYWFARPLQGWIPPQDLCKFLRDGDTPVAVSLGVMSGVGRKARETAELVLDAIHKAGVRAIIQGWKDILLEMDVSPSVYCAGSMPHDWLFDQVSAVILHGGFGTTAAVLRAGVPAIVIPHVIDQFYWGQRVVELGVGPKFISRGKLTSDNLSQAITQALADSTMLEKAAQLGANLRAELDGVAHAIQGIENVFSS